MFEGFYSLAPVIGVFLIISGAITAAFAHLGHRSMAFGAAVMTVGLFVLFSRFIVPEVVGLWPF